MIYCDFQGKQLSALGFGCMRLPVTAEGAIDQDQVQAMTDYAMAHGGNYFDTAYPYHGGQSEIAIGKALSKYPRESYYLANKFPGHQLASSYDPAGIFEEQLKKCGVEYFDFYLLHNVHENSYRTYLDPRWGILEYFKEQKRLGRIRHLGFSSHGRLAMLKDFLDVCGGDMEFCQLQVNYLDWTLQDARAKYELMASHNIPVWVMEPVRGGKLANLKEADAAALKGLRPQESSVAWCFRFLQGLPNVKMILSGMSDMQQMRENISTFEEKKPLLHGEEAVLMQIAEGMKQSIPCTSCRYCCDGCPMGLNIPVLLDILNDLRVTPSVNTAMYIEFLPEDKKPDACVKCGKCAQVCPQGISIPELLEELSEIMKKAPSWVKISKEREEAAKRLREGK